MTRRVNKFDMKMPSPIPISKRPSSRVDLQTRLRKIDREFQQEQQQVPSSSSTFMISNLKQQLSHIKQDVEKLMFDDEDFEQRPLKIQAGSGLRQEMQRQQQTEAQLRKEIKQLKIRQNQSKAKEQRSVYLMKEIDIFKRQRDILVREKAEAEQKSQKLRQQLLAMKVSQGAENEVQQLRRKIDRNRQQKQENDRTKKFLESQNERITKQLEDKATEKQRLEDSLSEWKQEKYRLESEISKLKIALTNAQNNPEWREETARFENQIASLKSKLVTSISSNEWKEQKSRLEAEISKYKLLSNSTGDQWKQEKVRLENEISRLQVQNKKSKQLLDSKYKVSKEQMVSSINSIKDLTEKNYEFVRKINTLESELEQKSSQLRKKEQLTLQQKQQIKTINKEKDTRYANLMSEFRKLQDTLNKSSQENMSGMKNTIFSLQNSLRVEQADKEKLRTTIADLNQKIQRLTFNLSEEKRINQQLQQRLKEENKTFLQKESKLSRRMSLRVDELQTELATSRKDILQKRDQMVGYVNQIKQLQNYKNGQEKLKAIQIKSLQSSQKSSELISQITRLKQTMQMMQVELFQKSKMIQKLSQSTQKTSSRQEILKVELKYKEMIQELNATVDENELTILRLENEISELKKISKRDSISAPRNSSFDDILKEHLRENEELKLQLKSKAEEIYSLKTGLEDYRRKIDFQRNQSQIDKLKNLSDEKKIKSHYEIQLQNKQSQMQSQKRKFQSLQLRLDSKVDQLKKKDAFIQSVIVSKVGKQAAESELQYITRQVQKFLNTNYVDKLAVAEQQIRILKHKMQIQSSPHIV